MSTSLQPSAAAQTRKTMAVSLESAGFTDRLPVSVPGVLGLWVQPHWRSSTRLAPPPCPCSSAQLLPQRKPCCIVQCAAARINSQLVAPAGGRPAAPARAGVHAPPRPANAPVLLLRLPNRRLRPLRALHPCVLPHLRRRHGTLHHVGTGQRRWRSCRHAWLLSSRQLLQPCCAS